MDSDRDRDNNISWTGEITIALIAAFILLIHICASASDGAAESIEAVLKIVPGGIWSICGSMFVVVLSVVICIKLLVRSAADVMAMKRTDYIVEHHRPENIERQQPEPERRIEHTVDEPTKTRSGRRLHRTEPRIPAAPC